MAGAVVIAGVLGYFKGTHALPQPEAIAHNRERRERFERARAALAAGNAVLRARAPMRVRIGASPP